VDASKGFAKEGKNNKLRASDIKKITDTVIGRLSVPRYSRLVPRPRFRPMTTTSTSRAMWTRPSPPRAGICMPPCLAASRKRAGRSGRLLERIPQPARRLFADNGTPYAAPKVPDLAQATRAHPEVQQYSQAFAAAFADFTPWLRHALLDKCSPSTSTAGRLISEELFARLAPLPLIDRYHAYQILDDHWQPIAIDLEILQTEGFDASRVVDPNFVTKKKDGKDVEVQDGWKGRILPFELVQMTTTRRSWTRCAKRNPPERNHRLHRGNPRKLQREERPMTPSTMQGDKFVSAAVTKEAKSLLAEAKKTGDFDPNLTRPRSSKWPTGWPKRKP
jgi:type I restriction enzyme M protein